MENPEFITKYYTSPESKQTRIQPRIFVIAENSPDKGCSCERTVEVIKCKKCSYVFSGRKRIQCNIHPNVIHLMDFSLCPKCNQEL